MYRIIAFLVLLTAGLPSLDAQRCGRTDTIQIADFGTSTVTVPIAGYINSRLSNPAQGLCNVRLHFQHSYVYDVTVTLTSPAGQSVQLIGPINAQTRPPTTLARWFVDFVPCFEPAMPDPGAPTRWNNDSPFNWAIFGQYSGSYRPANGCLDGFSQGSVNGDWTLTFDNRRAGQQGVLTYVLLEFCDDRHVDGPCCQANAGELQPDPTIVVCEGPSNLPLDLRPRYMIPRPDENEYDYTFLISRNDSVLFNQTDPNLAGFPAGDYEICGLSYRASEATQIPLNGDFSFATLRQDLASADPTLCADLTPVCQTVRLTPIPDTTFVNELICIGDAYELGGQSFTTSGRYAVDLPGFAGCDSTVVLDLEVVTQLTEMIDTTICAEAAFVVGDSVYTQPGSYRDTILSVFGCDSVVVLDLAVAAPIIFDTTLAICAPDSFLIGDERFGTTGRFTRVISAANGCDSTVNLDLVVLEPTVATAPFSPTLTCAEDTILLDATPSRLDFGADFFWADTLGNVLTNGLEFNAAGAGDYVFTLSAALRGTTCTERDTFRVEDRRFDIEVDLARPQVPCELSQGPCATLSCASPELDLFATPDSLGPTYRYAWTGPSPTAIPGPTNGEGVILNEPGSYTLIVTDSATACRLDTSFTVFQDIDPVSVTLTGNELLNCVRRFDTLVADTLQPRLAELDFRWTAPAGCPALPGNPDDRPTFRTNCPGEYTLSVTNRTNGCRADTTFTVERDLSPVTLALTPNTLPPPLTCTDPTQTFDASASSSAAGLEYAWLLDADTVARTPRVTLDFAGDYRLVLTDRRSRCTASRPISIPADTLRPVTIAGPDTVELNCYASTARLGTDATSTGGDLRHYWTDVNRPQDTLGRTPFLGVDPPGGFFVLTTENVRNGCLTRDSVRVPVSLDTPNLRPALPRDFDCFIDSIELDLSATLIDFTPRREWTGPCLPTDADRRDRIFVYCPGDYTYSLTNVDNGCVADTTLPVGLAQTGVVAILADTFRLDCETGRVDLDRRLGTDAPVVRWELNGTPITLFGQEPTVTVPGEYTLILGNFNESCLDTARTTVVADCPAFAAIIPPDSLTCVRPVVTLNAENSVPPPGQFESSEWITPPGAVVQAGATDRMLNVFSPGRYGFVVRNALAGAADTLFVEVVRNQVQPVADAGPRDTVSCRSPTAVLNGTGSSSGELFDYVWTTTRDDTVGFRRIETVDRPGTYLLRVTQRETGCTRVDNVTVIRDLDAPAFTFTPPEIPCDTVSHPLGVMVEGDGPFTYAWAGEDVLANPDSDTTQIGTEGWYFVTVTDPSNGCATTDSVFARRLPCPPFPSLADTSLTCATPEPVLRPRFRDPCGTCTFRWQRNGVNLPGQTGDTLRVMGGTGVYALIVTNEFGLVGRAEARVVDSRILPEGNAGPDRVLTCARTSVLLGAQLAEPGFDYRYQWSRIEDGSGAGIIGQGGAVAGATVDTLRVSNGGIYTLLTTNLFSGCSVLDTAMVTYDTLAPRPDAGPSRILTCNQKQRVLDGINSDLGPRYRYAWTSAVSPLCLEGATTLNPSVRCENYYYLTVIDTVNGCRAVDSVLVENDDELPPITPLADTTLNCAINSVELQGGPFPDANFSGAWWQLRREGPLPVTEIAPDRIAVTEPGRFQFLATNDLTGCTNEFTLEVFADRAAPLAEAGLTDTFYCALDSLLLTGVADGRGVDDLATNWRSQTGFVVNDIDSLVATIFQPDVYYFEVLNRVNQCSALDSVTIFRDVEAPVAEAGRDTSLNCERRRLNLSGSWVSQSGQGRVEWMPIEGSILSGASTLSPRIDAGGRYQLNVVDPVNDCGGADVVFVVEDTIRPTAAITGTDATPLNCYAPTRTLSGLTSAGRGQLNYAWMSNRGTLDSLANVTVDAAGRYRLEVVDRGNVCRDTATVVITQDFAPPTFATLEPDVLDCATDSVMLRIAAPQADTLQRYFWADARGVRVGMGNDVPVGSPGEYRLYTLNVLNGCFDSLDVAVLEDRLAPTVNLLPPDTLNCEVGMVDVSGIGSDRGPTFTPIWSSFGGDFTATEDDYTIKATEPGFYYLEVVNTINRCRTVDSVEVQRSALIIDDLLLTIFQPACPTDITGEAVVEGIEGGRGPFQFRINGGTLTDRLVYEDLPLGEYELAVFGSDGCSTARTFTILPGEPVELSLRRDTLIALGDSLTLNFTTNLPRYDTLIWTSNGPLPDSIPPGPLVVTPLSSQGYRLRIIGDDGCAESASVVVEVDGTPAIYVPTAFSPNGDGTNDLLRPYVGRQVSEILDFRVYDRWGEKLYDLADDPFRSTDVFGWDGALDGRPLNPQVVVWQMRVRLLNGEVVLREGEVVLVR